LPFLTVLLQNPLMSTEYNANGTLFTKWMSNNLKPKELERFKKSVAYKNFIQDTLALVQTNKNTKQENTRMLKALL